MNQATEELLKRKARFCLATAIPPSEYDLMTLAEVAAFIKQHNDNHKKK